jgi:hypothetical protein
MSGRAKRNLVTAIVIAVLIVFVLILGSQSTGPKVTGDTISRTFSNAEPCATADIALAVPASADPAKTAETLFSALEPVKSLTTATYNIKTACIDVGFCESQTNEEALRSVLGPTGLLAAVDASAAPAAQ